MTRLPRTPLAILVALAALARPAAAAGKEEATFQNPILETWERVGRPHVNEGPQVLRRGDRVFVVYSASGSWTDDCCLGQLALQGGDPLDPKAWRKLDRPVFSRTDRVRGPGHASFTRSPDGREGWIVYHSARAKGSGWYRQINAQRFGWTADGAPDLGRPIPPGTPIAVPSGSPPAR